MTKNDAIKIAKPFCKHYPNVNEFHVTADEQVFEDKNHAANHAKTFKEKENQVVITVTAAEEVEASKVDVTPLIVGVPDGAVVQVNNPDSVILADDETAQQIADEATKEDASDTTPIDADDVDTTAESIDDVEPGGSAAQMYDKKPAKKTAKKAATKKASK